MRQVFIISLFVVSALYSYSQRCSDYYTSMRCKPTPQEAKDMILSSQSRGAELEAGQTYTFRMTFFRNMDYRLIFCTPPQVLPNSLRD
ncbi:MAG: hypothetical protein RBT74_08055 [Tenuifilaceae bacterium]|jgi:hypothetical protein|nr:hypothetical protein [Tenuifilaceae bacterium]